MENQSSVVEFFSEIGIELTEEQEKAVISNLRLKKKGKTPYFESVAEKLDSALRLPRQAEVCFKALANADKPLDLDEWGVAALDEGLQTRQAADRICAYYKQRLIDEGLIRQVRAEDVDKNKQEELSI